jgi:predicted transposase/invertase (TIGR01784 family)
LQQSRLKHYQDIKNSIDTAEEKGREEGMQQGAEARNLAIAKNMLKLSIDVKLIQEATGLAQETIETFKQE